MLAHQLGTVIWAMKRFVPASVDGGTATVIGVGSAGLFFVQLLRQWGFDRVVASDLSERRLTIAESYGAHVTVRADYASVSETTLEVTHGEGADLVVEAVGSARARSQAIASLKLRGRLCLFGLPEGPEATLAPLESLVRRQATVEMSRRAQYEPGLKSFRQASTMLENGAIDVSGMISHIFPLADLDKAINLASTRDDGAVKVCLRC